MLPCITYMTLAIDLGLHGSWQNFYLQRFDYTLIIFFRQLRECMRIQLPEEDYQSIIETLQIKFANYREVQDLSPTSYPYAVLLEDCEAW